MYQTNNLFLFESSRFNTPTHFALLDSNIDAVPELKKGVHWHNYFEFEIATCGDCIHYLNGSEYRITRGEAHLLRYSDFHTYRTKNNTYTHLFNFNFDEAALPESITNLLLNSSEPMICFFDEEELTAILNDIDLIFKEQPNSDDPLKAALLTATFTKIVLTFLCKCNKSLSNDASEHSVTRFNDIISMIHCHFREDLSLNQLAKAVGLTPNHLGLLFKSQVGENFTSYLKKVRLNHAKNLLKHSNLSIAEVSEYSGFKSVSYFIQCFKSKYNLTPKQYIMSLENEQH